MLILLFSLGSDPALTNPVELGKVRWLRTMDEAISKSRSECKPILILFQEVPGCITCRQYGTDVLSHPLIVETIETHFIPLAIFNNKGGHDAEILKKFNEPAWNNPVVRIVDEKGKDLSSRLNGNYTGQGLTDMMTNVVIKVSGRAPAYLQLMSDEFAARKNGLSTATYSMYCFWSGEALFGELNGVVATTAGWENGKEVVKVEFNPAIISKTQLDKIAEQLKCRNAGVSSFKIDDTPKYYLSNHKMRSIPMTEIQKCRVNSAIAEGQKVESFLSPRQLNFLTQSTNANFVSVSLEEAWVRAEKR